MSRFAKWLSEKTKGSLRPGDFEMPVIIKQWTEELLEEREHLQCELASLKQERDDLARKLEPSMNIKEPAFNPPPPPGCPL